MTTFKATVRGGRIELDEPLDLPDGTELRIALPNGEVVEDDDDGPMSQEEIERVLATMDAMIPLQMSEEEILAWEVGSGTTCTTGSREGNLFCARRQVERDVEMRRYLLDTGIAGDYLNKRKGVFDEVRRERASGSIVGIGMPVLAELVFGIEKSSTRDANFNGLISAIPALKLWPFDKAAAFEYGRLAAELRRIGRPMQVIDIMIAAIAPSLGNCTVVSKDGDLAAVPGLSVENWAS